MEQTNRQAAAVYAESQDNESGGFLTHQIIAIRTKAFLAGAKHSSMKWKSIKSAPKDNTEILLGLWVHNNQQPEPHFETYVGFFDVSTDCVYSIDFCELPWEWKDFEYWCELPKEPRTPKRFGKGGV